MTTTTSMPQNRVGAFLNDVFDLSIIYNGGDNDQRCQAYYNYNTCTILFNF